MHIRWVHWEYSDYDPPYRWHGNSLNYVEFLSPVAETISELFTSRVVFPGIFNSGGGSFFLELGAYKVPQVRGH